MKRTPETNQRDRDEEYEKQYKAWVAGMSPSERRELESMNLLKPDFSRTVSKGQHDHEILENREAPSVEPFAIPKKEEGVYEQAQRLALRWTRIGLSNILNPTKGSTVEYEAAIVGLSIGSLGMVSISHQAHRFGVGRAAISKRCVAFCKDSGMPPSHYMKSASNRAVHQLANVRKKRVCNG